MTTKNVADTAIKVAKVIGSCIATAAIVEVGYLGGKMLENDVEYTAKTINNKINPTIMRKKHWFSKPQPYNPRKKQFVADMKASKKLAKKSK